MNTFIPKFKEFFTSHHSKFIAGIVAIAALSLPFIINQVLKQQDIRQRADTAPSITFNFSPATQNMTVGQTLNVDLMMNADTNDVSALHFKLKYDPTILEIAELAQSTSLQSIQKPNAQGVFEAVMINPNATPVTGNGLKVFSFKFKALKSGTANVTLEPDSLQATSQLSTTYLIVDNKNNIKGNYTITNSPVDDSCYLPNNKPFKCQCENNNECASGSCVAKSANDASDFPAKYCTNVPTTIATISATTTTTVAPSPIPSQIPTITLAPGETGLKLSLSLPGISKTNGENAHPLRTRRAIKVTVYDSVNESTEKVAEKTGTVDFNPTTAKYEGNVGIGTTLTTGNYIVKVRMDNTLKKRLPSIVHIVQTTPDNPTSTAELVTGDIDQNNALDIQDFTNIMACFNHQPACSGDILTLGDLDDDGITNGDNDDISIMQYNTINRKGD